MHLYIAYKRYSSWSLRPWLAMKVAGIEFEETLFPFAHDDSLLEFAKNHQIPATVPVLSHDGNIIWDSMAILEYLAELYPEKNLWPANRDLRALARSGSAEMHSGFGALRSEHPMNCHLVRSMSASKKVQQDLDRLAVLWELFSQAKAKVKEADGDFLCGEFSIADAMFAPVAWRVKSYNLKVSDEFNTWSNALMKLPEMAAWVEGGEAETWRVDAYENIGL